MIQKISEIGSTNFYYLPIQPMLLFNYSKYILPANLNEDVIAIATTVQTSLLMKIFIVFFPVTHPSKHIDETISTKFFSIVFEIIYQ